MSRQTPARGVRSYHFVGAASCLLAMTLVGGCSTENPTEPGSYSLSGRVRLTGYLVDGSGRFLGTREVDDADGVNVELRHGNYAPIHSTTVDGVYQFDGLAPGAYTVRAQVIGDIADETNTLTIVRGDLVSGDTLRLRSLGDILPYPNPAADIAYLSFALPDTQQVDIRVRDMQGNTIQVIVSADLLPNSDAVAVSIQPSC